MQQGTKKKLSLTIRTLDMKAAPVRHVPPGLVMLEQANSCGQCAMKVAFLAYF